MIYLLTIFVGAVVGGLISFVANKFVTEIDEQVLVSQIKLVSLGCVSGACLSVFLFSRFSSWDLLIAYSILCSGLVMQTIIDLLTHRLVRSITHLMAVFGLTLLIIHAIRTDKSSSLISALICAVGGWVLFFVVNKVSPGGIGLGDVRLVPVLGWYLGFLGYNEAIWAIFIACATASVIGLGLITAGRGSLQRKLAFGPYLAFGSIVCIFASRALPSVFLV